MPSSRASLHFFLSTITQILDNAGLAIEYNYSDLRLYHIEYPNNPEMNVQYEYGAAVHDNQSSRLIRMQDASGVQTFTYGNMGELIENFHTFVVPVSGGDNYTFQTNWEYDSWNRIKNITYPDGETVSYEYDNGGKLIEMYGDKNGNTYAYIDNVLYDKYGMRSSIYYGNNTYALYTYNPLNLRLTNLKSYEASGLVMQNIDYSYDNAGNILGLSNKSDVVNGNMGGDYEYTYSYDDLYRLSSAYGYFDSQNLGTLGYETSMDYSASGNILEKNMYAERELNGTQSNINYSNTYLYNNSPHTVTDAGSTQYSWDPNGNMIFRSTGSTSRNLCWDEENRLVSVKDEGETEFEYLSAYIYDGGGERVWKLTNIMSEMYINGEGYVQSASLEKTLYTSPLMVVTEQEYTKHYFIEGERVATKIGGGFANLPYDPINQPLDFINGDYKSVSQELETMVGRDIECVQYNEYWTIDPTLEPVYNESEEYEENQYFYHPDHLGSSSFITNAIGYAEQHLQYLPYGESFIDQRNSYSSRYTFSAKEKDDETQYSYFGARYYDSDLSVWLSVDPLSDMYPSMSPYMYTAGNPVRLIDPNGMSIDDVLDGGPGKKASQQQKNSDRYISINSSQPVIMGSTKNVSQKEVGGVGVEVKKNDSGGGGDGGHGSTEDTGESSPPQVESGRKHAPDFPPLVGRDGNNPTNVSDEDINSKYDLLIAKKSYSRNEPTENNQEEKTYYIRYSWNVNGKEKPLYYYGIDSDGNPIGDTISVEEGKRLNNE